MEKYFEWKLFFDYYLPAILCAAILVAVIIGYILQKIDKKISERRATKKGEAVKKGKEVIDNDGNKRKENLRYRFFEWLNWRGN